MRMFLVAALLLLAGCADPDTSDDSEARAPAGADDTGTGGSSGKPGTTGADGNSTSAASSDVVESKQAVFTANGPAMDGIEFQLEDGRYGLVVEPLEGAFVNIGAWFGECEGATSVEGVFVKAGAEIGAGTISHGKRHDCGMFSAGVHSVDIRMEAGAGLVEVTLLRATT